MNDTLAVGRRLVALGRHYLRSRRADNSFAGEYGHLAGIVKTLGMKSGYVVDIAASDGVNQSCTLGFFQRADWEGLAVEMSPEAFAKLAFIYSAFPGARLARGRVTPLNVVSLLRGYEVPLDFTLLNLDIDSYDLHVISAMLESGYRPAIITMEVNEKIPPPIFFTVNYDDAHYWKMDHFYGCSLVAAASAVRPAGYILESLQYNNAIFIRSDLAAGNYSDRDLDTAYEAGYRSRPERHTLFPWNADLESLQTMSPQEGVLFLREVFAKYEGKFSLDVA
jgi:hypothetical protein